MKARIRYSKFRAVLKEVASFVSLVSSYSSAKHFNFCCSLLTDAELDFNLKDSTYHWEPLIIKFNWKPTFFTPFGGGSRSNLSLK